MSKCILIFGATGKQGNAVLRALLAHPAFSPTEYTILAATRNPDSPGAHRLTDLSPAIKLVRGDIAKADETFKNLPAQPWGVYAMTMPGKGEAAQGITIAEAAAKAGAKHFVFSSVDRGPGNGPTDVPHFKTKHEIEERIYQLARADDQFTYTIIRPPFFLDNLQPGIFGRMSATMWRDKCPNVSLAVVDTRDIGKLAAAAFLEPDNPKYRNQSLNLAGDSLTFAELNEKFISYTGSPVPTTYSLFPSVLLFLVSDVAKMIKFMQTPGFDASPQESKKFLPQLTDTDQWLEDSQHQKKGTN